MKTPLVILALVLLGCLVLLLRSQPDEPVAATVSETSRGPSFEVRVVPPRLGRPLFGLMPEALVSRVGGIPREVRFDQASPGAEVGTVGHDRLELRAGDGWDLSIETDGQGRIAPGTRLVFPLFFEEKQTTLRCRPQTVTRLSPPRGGTGLGGSFLLRLATCEEAQSERSRSGRRYRSRSMEASRGSATAE